MPAWRSLQPAGNLSTALINLKTIDTDTLKQDKSVVLSTTSGCTTVNHSY